jgi:hypothetical protein
MIVLPLILHFNTKEHTENLCRELPDAVVIANCESYDLDVPNRIIQLGQNYGFTEGWNKGVQAAMALTKAKYFWLCNSDIIPYKDCFQNIERSVPEMPNLAFYGIFTPNYNCWNEEIRHRDGYGFRSLKFIEFTAPVIARWVFEKIGYFDSKNFPNGYGVEYDFCFRAHSAGIKVGVLDTAEFYHIRKQSIKQLPDQQKYEEEGLRQQGALYAKHQNHNLFGNMQWKENRKQRAAVYTTIFGKYDILRSVPEQSVDVDFICVCDIPPDCENAKAAEQWRIMVMPANGHTSSRMLAKNYKCVPYDCPALKEYDNLIFIDASIKVTSRDFVRFSLANLTDERFSVSLHGSRTNIFDEAIKSASLDKYQGQDVMGQAETYRKKGFTEQRPLYECGYIVRNMRSENVRSLCGTWLKECIAHTYQDQISLPFVCWVYRFTPATFNSEVYKSVWNNKYFKVLWNPRK